MLGRLLERSVRLSVLIAFVAPTARAQETTASAWIKLEPLPGEMKLHPRESFDGVPPRFVLLTDGTVFVGGRREILKGSLGKAEMQAFSTRLDLAIKAFGKTGIPRTLVLGEGPAVFRFSVQLGSPLQVVVQGNLESTPAPKAPHAQLQDYIRRIAGFRHPSLKPYEPERFTMIVRERTLPGGCRSASGLPPLASAVSVETTASASMTLGFPTGADITQVCEGPKRYAVVFRPLIPGDR